MVAARLLFFPFGDNEGSRAMLLDMQPSAPPCHHG